jgi:Fic family protein
MGLPVDFYEGRHDPDHTQWLEYFLGTMARAAEALREQAVALYDPENRPAPPWERLRRVQQQLLTRLVVRGLNDQPPILAFAPSDVVEWFGVSATTAREWLDKWRGDGFVQPAKPGAQRVRNYLLTETCTKLIEDALRSARPKKP